MSEHEQPDVVLADPRRLQALRRALEARAVLTYCTDGATFHCQRPLSAGLPVGSYVTLEVPGGATYFGQVITQQVVLRQGPLIGVELDMDLTDDAGASKVCTTGAGGVFAWLRLRSRSVFAPVLAHAAVNVSAYLAGRLVVNRQARSDGGPGDRPSIHPRRVRTAHPLARQAARAMEPWEAE